MSDTTLFVSWQLGHHSNIDATSQHKSLTNEEKLSLTDEIIKLRPTNVILTGIDFNDRKILYPIIEKFKRENPHINIIVHFKSLNFSFKDFIFLIRHSKFSQFNISEYLECNDNNIVLLNSVAKKINRKSLIITPLASYLVNDFLLTNFREIVMAILPLGIKQLNIIQTNPNERRKVFELIGETQVEFPDLHIHFISPAKRFKAMIENKSDNNEVHIYRNGDVGISPFINFKAGNLRDKSLSLFYRQTLINFWRENDCNRVYSMY